MLQSNNRDWCHTYIPWERPQWIAKLDHLAGIEKGYLKCSYMVMSLPESSDKKIRRPDRAWRVVSGPLNSKGKSERLLCGANERGTLLRVMRQDRDRSEANYLFDTLERGDVIELPMETKVRKDTKIRRMEIL